MILHLFFQKHVAKKAVTAAATSNSNRGNCKSYANSGYFL
jgi:hypothetical protein